MEEQIPASNFPPNQQASTSQITPDQLEQMKARAREAAILQTYAQQQQQQAVSYQTKELAKIVYIKRPLTVAEILLMLLLSCGIVFGVQVGGSFILNNMPSIEIKMK